MSDRSAANARDSASNRHALMDVATVVRATGAQVLRVDRACGIMPGNLSVADLRRPVSAVSIDSRSTPTDGLFVALKGERVDGHDFAGEALDRGALGCILSRFDTLGPMAFDPGTGAASLNDLLSRGVDPRPAFLFLVPDPLEALGKLASYWRLHHPADVIGITGSVGKTTTKEILAGVLASRWPVLKSEGNLNTEIGLPLTLLRLRPEHHYAVLEMGMHAAGDIALLARVGRPRIGVVTNVAPVHLERMGSVERIAREKSELIAALPADGLAVLNGDDPWTRAMAITSGIAPVRLVGLAPDCDYRAADVASEGLGGLSFTIRAEGRQVRVRTRVPGRHTIHAFLSAAAVARQGGMEWDELQGSFADVRLETRQRVIAGPQDMVVVDDTYNASPLSMKAALELLSAIPGTKIAVLGDMLELGAEEETAHRDIGARAAELADWLIARGPRSRWIAEEARRRGMPAGRVRAVDSNAEAAAAVAEIAGLQGRHHGETISARDAGARTMTASRGRSQAVPSEGERQVTGEPGAAGGTTGRAQWAVLVKGSRGMRMEDVVPALRREG